MLGVAFVGLGASDAIGGPVSAPSYDDLMVLDASLDVGHTPVADIGRRVLALPTESDSDHKGGS